MPSKPTAVWERGVEGRGAVPSRKVSVSVAVSCGWLLTRWVEDGRVRFGDIVAAGSSSTTCSEAEEAWPASWLATNGDGDMA